MFDPADRRRLFGLPPGARFPEDLVGGLLQRMDGRPLEAMARVTLYLNTARMRERVRTAFAAHGVHLLPRLRLVTDIGADIAADLPPAVPALRRRLELAELVSTYARRTDDAVAAGMAFELAETLADIMEEMQDEGVSPTAIESQDLAPDHAAHWQRSLAFLRIATQFVARSDAPDPAGRQRLAVEALIQVWRDAPPPDPVVIAGSTGSRGTTSLLLQAALGLPQGAVVLPGFDFDLPPRVWDHLRRADPPPEDHPQYRFGRLLDLAALDASEVQRWPVQTHPDAARNRLVSLALRPAPVTDDWLAEGPELGDLLPATAALTLVEAPDQRVEALAIAVRLRAAVEEGKSAALVTPDRSLTRRVTAALDRWRIVPDDSAGQPLSLTAPGRLLRQVAALFAERVTALTLLALLKHPLAASGADRGLHLLATRELELAIRQHGPAFPCASDISDWGHKAGLAPEIAGWAQWVADLLARIAAVEFRTLAETLETHLAIAETLALGPSGDPARNELWREAAGEAALSAMTALRNESAIAGPYPPSAFRNVIDRVLAGNVPRPTGAHPLVSFWGTLDVRALAADIVILGGLSEGTWPVAIPPDTWLSRQMRRRAGMRSPERQIGLSAHDFQQAIAAREVVLTRPVRDAEAETVRSRWLARLVNLLGGLPAQNGGAALEAMTERGQHLIGIAGQLDVAPPVPKPAPRPAPIPPADKRPKRLSVTEIATLITDPYAIYARHILRLRPLDPLVAEPDARDRGIALHTIMQEFVTERPDGESAETARSRLLGTAARVLERTMPWPATRVLWLARLERIADELIADEAERARMERLMAAEAKGEIGIDGTGFTLSGRLDRVDVALDGSGLRVIDYKSGKAPAPKEVRSYNLQLPLEAAMIERGGFAGIPARRVARATYIGLGAGYSVTDHPLHELPPDMAWDRLRRLIEQYARADTPYKAHRMAVSLSRKSDYDLVSRRNEWTSGDDPFEETVG